MGDLALIDHRRVSLVPEAGFSSSGTREVNYHFPFRLEGHRQYLPLHSKVSTEGAGLYQPRPSAWVLGMHAISEGCRVCVRTRKSGNMHIVFGHRSTQNRIDFARNLGSHADFVGPIYALQHVFHGLENLAMMAALNFRKAYVQVDPTAFVNTSRLPDRHSGPRRPLACGERVGPLPRLSALSPEQMCRRDSQASEETWLWGST